MSDRPKVLCESALQDMGNGSAGFYRVPQISSNDTLTFSDFTTITGIAGYLASNQAPLTFTISNNVVTITNISLTNVKCYILVVGIR